MVSGWESILQGGGRGFSPWSGTRMPRAVEQLKWYTTTRDPVCHNYWSPCALEPARCSYCACEPQVESPCIAVKDLTWHSEDPECRNKDLTQPYQNKRTKYYWVIKIHVKTKRGGRTQPVVSLKTLVFTCTKDSSTNPVVLRVLEDKRLCEGKQQPGGGCINQFSGGI